MKLNGRNFQSWASFDLDIDKLTVIVGPSNKGKSAIFRALRGLFRNDLPADFVRNNQDNAMEVYADFDGHRIVAARTKKGSTKYRIYHDPQRYCICSGGHWLVHEDKVPEFIKSGYFPQFIGQKSFDYTRTFATEEEAQQVIVEHNLIAKVEPFFVDYTALGGKLPSIVEDKRLGEVTIGDYTLDPIFAEQNKAQFLIDADRWKATELNAILGAFASTEKLDAGKKEANTRITQKNGEAKTLGAEIREAEERKAKLAEISVKAEEVQGKVHTLEAEIRKLETVGAWVLEAVARRQRLAPLQKLLTEITIPDVSVAELLYKQTIYLTQAADAGNYSKWLRKVESVLVDVSDKWSEVVRIYKQQKSLVETMELLNKKEHSSSQLIAKKLSAVITSLETTIEEAVSLQSSIKYIAAVQVYQQRITAKEAELLETENALSDARTEVEEINRLVAEAKAKEAQPGLCPRCGEPLEHICE